MIARAGALLALLCACSDPEQPARELPDDPAQDPEPEPPDPDPPRVDPAPGSSAAPEAPPNGCAFGAPVQMIGGGDGWASIVAAHGGFLVAGTVREGSAEHVFVAELAHDGRVELWSREPLEPPLPPEHRRAGPALAASANDVALLVVRGDRMLALGRLVGRSFAFSPIAPVASERFSPALAHDGAAWIAAWTDESEAPVRVRVAQIPGDYHDVRAPNGNGTAPAFVAGASALLAFFDAREGLSVAHRVRIEDGTPRAIEVAQPINLIASPPELAAVQIGDALWIAYTAVGTLATTAVGLMRAGSDGAPVPIVRGTGYGTLHVHAASLGERAAFVADAPRAAPPESPRELHVRVLDANGTLSDPAIVRGPSGSGARGRIAYAGNGIVAVSFTERDGVYAALGRCAL